MNHGIYSPVGTFSCLHQWMKASALCPGSRKRDNHNDKGKKTGMVRQSTKILREKSHKSFIKHILLETEYRLEAILEKKSSNYYKPPCRKDHFLFQF